MRIGPVTFFALDKFVPLNNYLKSLNYDTNGIQELDLRPQGRDTYGGQVQAITLIEARSSEFL